LEVTPSTVQEEIIQSAAGTAPQMPSLVNDTTLPVREVPMHDEAAAQL